MVIYNLEMSKNTSRPCLRGFLGKSGDLLPITYVKRITTPRSYFVYCDLVDPVHNLTNWKASTLLGKFDIRGKAFEKVHYQTAEQQGFHDASISEYVNSVTLSVKDADVKVFNFCGQTLHFELRIN